ncbi:MAG: diguanylate cyclase, partial [Terriglobus roseus]|nr:diguanylate cyclase [Terriglobus roseus]
MVAFDLPTSWTVTATADDFTARMLAEVRAGDVVARLGGDEFVVLLEPL